jgi:acyl-CoA thioesterase FadM
MGYVTSVLEHPLEVTEAVSGRLVAQGREIVVVDAKTRRPVPVPDDLRAPILHFEEPGGGRTGAPGPR